MVLNGNKNSLSDAGVSALMAEASALGAYYNVLINLPAIKDEKWVSKIKIEAERIVNEVNTIASSVKEEILKRLL
jgi:formiminotetrahydrofolate cyclodeaminase